MQLGPKAKEFLNKPSVVLKIRAATRGNGAARSKKGPQRPALASTVTTRKKRTQLDGVDDPVETFSPDNDEANFDDIEVESEPREPSTGIPPLVQASGHRAAPSIQVIEHQTEDTLEPYQECFKELCDLRDKV